MDGYSEYSVAKFRRIKYFSHKLIDRTRETRVLEKDTDILQRRNFYLGKNLHLATSSLLYCLEVFGTITLLDLKVKPFLIKY